MDYLTKSGSGSGTSGNSNAVPIDLLLSVVEYKTEKGRHKRGFCSNFLANLAVEGRVALHLKSNPSFHMGPLSQPTIWVGAGSGLAPFRGFWQKMSIDASSGGSASSPAQPDRLRQALLDYFVSFGILQT